VSGRQSTVALAAAGVALAAVAVFLPVRHHEFIGFDDPGYVTANAWVQRGLSADGIGWALTTTAQANWHPLTWLSHMLDVELFGAHAGAHHLVNVLLHALNGALVVLWLAAATGRVGRAAAVGLLFALHPLRVEVVAWIAERKELLAATFGLLALLAYVRAAKRPGRPRIGLVALCFALSLASKPMWVSLPFVLLLVDVWPLERLAPAPSDGDWRRWMAQAVRLAREKLVLFAFALGSALITLWAQAQGGAVATTAYVPLVRRLANAIVAYATYLVKSVWPGDLAVFYPYPTHIPAGRVALAALLLAALGLLAWRLGRRQPVVLVGGLWYVGTLVPVIGLVQVGSQALADRYTYLPLLGPLVAVVWLGADAAARVSLPRFAQAPLVVLLATACAVATREQLVPWRTSRALFEHALAVTEGNWVAHDFLGVHEAEEGRIESAMAHHREALRLRPDLHQAHNNLGVRLAESGRVAEAIEHYTTALDIAPRFAEAHNNLAIALAGLGRTAEAERHFREALAIRADNPEAHFNLGLVLDARGAAAEALDHFIAALELRPDWDELAVRAAWMLATLPDPRLRDGPRAVALARGAAPDAAALDALAAALAETGRFAEAAREAARARDLARAAGQLELASDIERRRQSYAAGRPWRTG
jgi:tetratricopeptide (TPR) repeat protein